MRRRPITICVWTLAVCSASGCAYDFDAPFSNTYWSAIDAATDVGVNEANVEGGNDAEAAIESGNESGSEAGEAGECRPTEKACGGDCVNADDPDYGCAPDTCEPCDLTHAMATCSDDACDVAGCTPDWGDCNGVAADGCEQILRDLEHCGACDEPCVVTTGQPTCVTGTCAVDDCDPLTADCNNNPSDGCEVDLTSNENCGGCGVPCELAHANTSCGAGVCMIVSCAAGWGDCDDAEWNGCETMLLADTENCGTCGGVCSSELVSERTCTNGLCVPTCAGAWGDCNGPQEGAVDDGCETNLDVEVSHCGDCGLACASPVSGASTGSAACVGGLCTVTCSGGLDACVSAVGPVCVNPNSDARFCGSSCSACQPGATCESGTCKLPSCSPGLTLCGTGCRNLQSDGDHCGACFDTCGLSCQNGLCPAFCNPSFVDCGNGCADLQTDPANCGDCGNLCSAGDLCIGGSCLPFVYASGCWACGLGNPYPTCCDASGLTYCLPAGATCL